MSFDDEQLLKEACELLEACFKSLGDPSGMRQNVSPELWKRWTVLRPKKKTK